MSNNASVNLLRQITRDPNYASRVAGTGDVDRSSGRQWDGRFTLGGIPKYDAVNDRFCKFSLRRRLAESGGKKGAAASGKLAPLPPQRRVWGQANSPEMPSSDAIDPTSFRGNAEAARAKANPEIAAPANLEALIAKSKQRITRLWEELGTPESDRMQFAQHHFNDNTTEALGLINDEIQKLLDERNGAVQVEKTIEIREGFLYLLQELTERYATTNMAKDRAVRELQALVAPFRNASLDAVEAILRWREASRTPTAPYLWKGVSYLHKMNTDLFFLVHSRLRALLDFTVQSNPLLDPRKADADQLQAQAAQSSKLPPLRRGGKDAAMKDLPKERLDRAERVLQEEAQRQRALVAPRAEAQLTVDEQAHLRNVLSEEDEKQQLIAEEDAWLREQNQSKNTQDIEQGSATRIQSAYRAYVARRFVNARLTQRKAAVKLQSLSRQFIAKLHVTKLREQVHAAKRIQALQRGIATRSRIGAVCHRNNAALMIQKMYRGYVGRRYADMLAYLRVCAVAIQRTFRGWRARSRVRGLVQTERRVAATFIQKAFRGYKVRCDPRYNATVIRKTIKLQAWFRGCNARRGATTAAVRRYAATRVQAWWRGRLAVKESRRRRLAKIDATWQAHLVRAEHAATKIQSVWRMHEARRDVRDVITQRRAAEQRDAMALLDEARAVHAVAEATRENAAIKVQALVRGHLGRQRARMLSLLNLTALQIQRVYRGRLGRVRAAAQAEHVLLQNSLAALAVTPAESPVAIASRMMALNQSDASVAQCLDMDDSHASQPHEDVAQPQAPAEAAGASEAEPVVADEARPTTVSPAEADVVAQSTDAPAAAADEATPAADAAGATTSGPAEATAAAAEPTASDEGRATEQAVEAPAYVATAAPARVATPPPAAVVQSTAAAADAPSASPGPSTDAAATRLVRFFRSVVAKRVVDRRRRAHRVTRADRDARVQEVEAAAHSLQCWVRDRMSVRYGGYELELRKQRRAVRIAAAGDPRKQERTSAATIIQRSFAPVVFARAAARNAAQLRNAAAGARQATVRDEHMFAAMIMQRAARRHIAHQRATDRHAAGRSQAASQEREYAAVALQCFARRAISKSRVASARARKEAQARVQEQRVAAVRLQAFGRGVAARSRASAVRAERESQIAAAVAEQERKYAAAIAQRAIRSAEARSSAAAAKAAREAAESAERQQELSYAATLVQAVGRAALARSTMPAPAVVATDAEPTQARASPAPARSPARSPAALSLTPTSTTPQEASRSRRRSVSFNAQDADRPSSHILSEPPLDQSGDADTIHDKVHVHDATAEAPLPIIAELPPQAAPAAAAPNVVDDEAHDEKHVGFTGAVVIEDDASPAASPHAAAAPADEAAAAQPAPAPVNTVEECAMTQTAAPATPADADEQPAPADEAQEKPSEATDAEADTRNAAAQDATVASPGEATTAVATAAGPSVAEQTAAASSIQRSARQRLARNELTRRREGRATANAAARQREELAIAAAETEEQERDAERTRAVRHAVRTRAATKIQCAYRCYNARFMRNWMLQRRTEQREAAAEAEFQRLQHTCALRIQLLARRYLARREARRRRNARATERYQKTQNIKAEEQAAIKIQCAYRSYNARFEADWRRRDKQRREATAEEHEAAAAERSANDQEAAEARKAAEAKAAVTVQCAYRSYNARFEVFQRRQARDNAEFQRNTAAAVESQRTGRGFVARKRMHTAWAKQRNDLVADAASTAIEGALERASSPRNDDDL